MNLILTILSVVSSLAIALHLAIQVMEPIWKLPYHCDCKVFPFRKVHWVTWVYLLATWVASIIVVFDLLQAVVAKDASDRVWGLLGAVVYGVFAVVWYRSWKKHRDANKKGLGARLLAKIQETVAGLKVVPLPQPHQMGLVALGAILGLLVTGCGPTQGGTSYLGPGSHKITKTMRGVWNADNAVKGCEWAVVRPKTAKKPRLVLDSGTWTRFNQSQSVILGTGMVGLTFTANEACGVWAK